MTTWIVLFRGINVGGKNILPMKELAKVLTDNGYANVKTYIQSGNVVLQSRRTKAQAVSGHIGKLVSASHGFHPNIFALRIQELEQAIKANPFPKANADPKSLHLSFLASTPKRPDLDAMKDIKIPSEAFVLTDKVLYLHAPDGVGRSKLAAKAERLLGVDATARNWRTVSKLRAIASEIE